jgi:erythromycin esterase
MTSVIWMCCWTGSAALAAYRCFEPYGEDAQQYGSATRMVPASCEDEVIDLLVGLLRQAAAAGRPGSGPGRTPRWSSAGSGITGR